MSSLRRSVFGLAALAAHLASTALALAASEPVRVVSRGAAPLGIALPHAVAKFRRDGEGYVDPETNGGQMLTIVNGTYPAGQGEPLNVILSANSAKEVLAHSDQNGGFLNYMLSANLGEECLGQHLGTPQAANLGDGKGEVNEVQVLRWNFGNPYIGTCQETFEGGLHLRYWIQNTTGAYFMAVSWEKDLASGHDIHKNGYNIGRDWLVGNLTSAGSKITTMNLTNTSTYSGESLYGNYTYKTDVQYVSGLMANTSVGINHNITVRGPGFNAVDGLVAVLTVTIVDRPQSSWAVQQIAAPSAVLSVIVVASGIYALLA